jgi:hypothetical protein
MSAHSPNPPTGEPIAADDGDAKDKAPVPQITLITKHGAQSLMSKRIALTSVARFAFAAADLRVSFPHGDPGLSDEPPTFESREFASAVAAQMRSAA